MKAVSVSKGSLLVGLALGLTIGVCAGIFGQQHLMHEAEASVPQTPAPPLPPPLLAPIDDPSVLVNTFQNPAAVQQQQMLMNAQQAPAGVVYDVTTTASGYPIYTGGHAVDAGNPNPSWTVGTNGLIQNPCVDPPSSHGRAYRIGQAY